MRVDQLLVGYTDGDAISREARFLRAGLRSLGYESDLFVKRQGMGWGVAGDCRPMEELAADPGNALIHHFASEGVASRFFRAFSGRRILRYHNLTSSCWFRGFDDRLAEELDHARDALAATASAADAVWSVSEFNARELRELGLQSGVIPLAVDLADVGSLAPDPAWEGRYGGPLTNLLAVGRVAPNKCLEDLIEAFAWYHATINPASRLILAGSAASCPGYFEILRFQAARLGQQNILFEGFVTDAQLAACYRSAHLLVSTSRHEGYGLPLLEAMARGVPVLARRRGGMPEAMGGAGVLYDHLDARTLAELIHALTSDADLRRRVLASQRERVARFSVPSPGDVAARFLA